MSEGRMTNGDGRLTVARPEAGSGGPDGTGSADPGTAAPADQDVARRRQDPEPVDALGAADRRRLRWAWTAGALPALLLYAWVLPAGRWDFFQQQFFDDFFDLQARAMLDGRLDVPADRVGFEGFVTGGKTYIYFGVVPSLLRIPVLALTDDFDGRLTTVSMLAGSIVLAVAAFRLAGAIRAVVRGSAPVGRVEQWATAGLAFTVLVGPPFFLASAATVYHEAILWGLALSVAGFDAVLRWQRDPTAWRLALASLLVSAAILSRLSVALGPLVALALSGALHLRGRWRGSAPESGPEARGTAAADRVSRVLPPAGSLALAALVPVVLSSVVNYAKFRQVFGVPPERQLHAGGMGASREAVLAEHPSYVSLEYLPTNFWQYFGPNGFELRRDLPWIDFPRNGPTLLDADVVYDALDWCSSLPATVPVLCLLAVAGLVWSIRSRRQRNAASAISPLIAGALVGAVTVIVFAYIANRYLNDLYPLVLIPGLVGFHAVGRVAATWRRSVRRAALAGAGVLVAAALAVNLSLALEYQRERGPAVPDDWRAEWVGARVTSPGAPEPIRIGLDDRLPAATDGALLVVGDCDGLYVGVRDRWLAVERGPGVGVHDVRIDLDQVPIGERVPLLSFGRGEDATVAAVVRLNDDTARVDVLGPEGLDRPWLEGLPRDLHGELTLRITMDRRQPANNVYRDGLVLNLVYQPAGDSAGEPMLGRAPARPGVASSFPGGVERIVPDMSVCRSALD